MRSWSVLCLWWCGLISMVFPVWVEAVPSPMELSQAAEWAAAKFDGIKPEKHPDSGIVVLANYGSVQLNSRDGQPLRIGDHPYTHGLYCHAASRLLVRLPAPASRFSAVAGIDTNGAFSGGSAVFVVHADGQELYRSPVMQRGQAGVGIEIDLKGVSEFILSVEDSGDNINSDQASWAEASVTLMDGRSIRLGDLPLIKTEPKPVTTDPPFSFRYGDAFSPDLLKDWDVKREQHALDEQRTARIQTWSDPVTGLQVRCESIEYHDFPVVEWTLHLKNGGTNDSPVLSDIRAVDTEFTQTGETGFTLHHHNGTYVDRTDYQPHVTTLKPGENRTFTPGHGRPCAGEFPYFNLETGEGGVILAVGWPGKWTCTFAHDPGVTLRLTAGQEGTHFILHPGEEVRSPLIVLQFWKGQSVDAQNTWRRWMWAHNVPRRDGILPPPQMPAVSGNQFPGLLCNETDELRYIDRFTEEKIGITHWWMDAGWYLNKGDWTSTGTWEVDQTRFPRGIRAVADHAHGKGLGLIVWFEPERVTAGSWITENHPEWVLGGHEGGLFNLGHPEAWKWMADRLDKIITDEGIDFYRQDFNMDPLPYWRANDTPERQGITEIRHVEGYLALWDELVRRHPKLMIDSCASGGHRNDLETMRRSVPLLRSDFLFDSIGEQCHTYGLASWIPYWGTGLIDFDTYRFRSCLGLDTTLSCDARRKDLDWDLLRKLTAEWKEVAPDFYGDYYPLTPYSLAEDLWVAWQFNRPEEGQGMVQAFRRKDCVYESARFRLRGLDPKARYEVCDRDQETKVEHTGEELMNHGLLVTMPQIPSAVIVTYQRKP